MKRVYSVSLWTTGFATAFFFMKDGPDMHVSVAVTVAILHVLLSIIGLASGIWTVLGKNWLGLIPIGACAFFLRIEWFWLFQCCFW
ncbi:MAG: hypothetical protein JWM32_541 [Verrucomicrobia bacterium]|nr:hypothetical protein [Verrucomicrobiota bacterium]